MHRIFFFLFTLCILLSPKDIFAGNKTVTEHYVVAGVCEKCKARIEKAAYDVKGVRYANWEVSTGEFTVKFDTSKTSADAILKNIARTGHDNILFNAKDDDYNKLPECCHYRSAIKKH